MVIINTLDLRTIGKQRALSLDIWLSPNRYV